MDADAQSLHSDRASSNFNITVSPTENTPLIHDGLFRANPDDKNTLCIYETSRGRFWAIFSQIVTVHFIASFDGTIMASSHPVIASYFDAAQSASWLSTSFLLASSCIQPSLGRLSIAIGRKPLFIAFLLILALATTLCAGAKSIGSLIVARAFCGLGAGGATTLGNIMLGDLVPVARRGRYQPYLSIAYGAGCALGAALGGSMAEYLGWRWEFGVQIPVMLLCAFTSFVVIPNDLGQTCIYDFRETLKGFDFLGSALLTIVVTSVVLSLNLGGLILPLLTSIAISVVGALIYGCVELRASEPVMPLRLVSKPPWANLVFSNFISTMLTHAILFNMPLYFRAVLLQTPSVAGLQLMMPSVICSAVLIVTFFAIHKTGYIKWALIVGSLSYVLGTSLLSFLDRRHPTLPIFFLIPTSVGQGLQNPGTLMGILAASEQKDQPVIISTLTLWRNLGMVMGIAVSSLLVQNRLEHRLESSVHGPSKEDIIKLVRSSIDSISKVEPAYREQVISSYEGALSSTFASCTILAWVSIVLILYIPSALLQLRKT